MRFSLTALLFFIFSTLAFGSSVDSLRTEKRGDQWVVIHQVDAGETLYAIARRYKADVNQVIKQNGIVNNAIKVGQLLEIPVSKGPGTSNATTKPATTDTKVTTHTVAAGEGLYAIARKYNVKVNELMAWNNLTSESLNVGQVLKINGSGAASTPTPTTTTTTSTTTTKPPAETKKLDESPATTREAFGKKIQEGIAMQIDDMEETDKYLALHKSLPIGTLVEVRNLMNNKKVYVRVVGQLPDTGVNQNVIVRLTSQSFKRLGILDARARVELTYYEE